MLYPARFELFRHASELIDGLTKMQLSFKSAARPQRPRASARSIIRRLLLGLADEEYDSLDREIDSMLSEKTGMNEPLSELPPAGITDQSEAFAGAGSTEEAGGEDPTGQSAGTMIGNMIPAVQ